MYNRCGDPLTRRRIRVSYYYYYYFFIVCHFVFFRFFRWRRWVKSHIDLQSIRQIDRNDCTHHLYRRRNLLIPSRQIHIACMYVYTSYDDPRLWPISPLLYISLPKVPNASMHTHTHIYIFIINTYTKLWDLLVIKKKEILINNANWKIVHSNKQRSHIHSLAHVNVSIIYIIYVHRRRGGVCVHVFNLLSTIYTYSIGDNNYIKYTYVYDHCTYTCKSYNNYYYSCFNIFTHSIGFFAASLRTN